MLDACKAVDSRIWGCAAMIDVDVLEAAGLTLSSEADPGTLIRRVTLNRSRAANLLDQDLRIMRALEERRTELAEVLTRQQTLDLAARVDEYGWC